MKILLEAHHPAHIHFWKYVVRELQDKGHEVLMIARDRDVMRRLLEAYDWIHAEIPKRRTRNNRIPLIEMFERQCAVARAICRFKPDVVASLMGSYTQTARLFGVRNVIFTDTETQGFNHRIAHPFADEIHTPVCFLKELGPKQRRYNGLHELAFLHPDLFMSDPAVLERQTDLEPGNYIVIRMSAWNTFHDRHRKGIGEAIYSFVDQVEKDYRIVLSAEENKVPPGLEKYVRSFPPEDFHHILGFSRFVLTEGASTATEAACLGVPSVFINSVGVLGNFVLLSREFELVHAFNNADDGTKFALSWLNALMPGLDQRFRENHQRFLNNHDNTCTYVEAVLNNATVI